MPEAVTKRPQRRTLAVAMLMLATTAGATVAGIAAASAAEPAHFAALAVPTPDNPAVGGNGIAATSAEAQSLALNGLSNLCKQAGYLDVAPGVQTNAAAASSGQSKTPDGNVLFTAFGECAEGDDSEPAAGNLGQGVAQAQAEEPRDR